MLDPSGPERLRDATYFLWTLKITSLKFKHLSVIEVIRFACFLWSGVIITVTNLRKSVVSRPSLVIRADWLSLFSLFSLSLFLSFSPPLSMLETVENINMCKKDWIDFDTNFIFWQRISMLTKWALKKLMLWHAHQKTHAWLHKSKLSLHVYYSQAIDTIMIAFYT